MGKNVWCSSSSTVESTAGFFRERGIRIQQGGWSSFLLFFFLPLDLGNFKLNRAEIESETDSVWPLFQIRDLNHVRLSTLTELWPSPIEIGRLGRSRQSMYIPKLKLNKHMTLLWHLSFHYGSWTVSNVMQWLLLHVELWPMLKWTSASSRGLLVDTL